MDNNELLRETGISKNILNQAKKSLSSLLKPVSKQTQLAESATGEIQNLFDPEYKPEEILWALFEDETYRKSIELLKRYKGGRPAPERKYDQFTATIETTARRASLMNFFEDVEGKKILFLGDDDFTSVAVANLRKASDITVLDIDNRILSGIGLISEKEKLNVKRANCDARKQLPASFIQKFDVVFTDPPYTPEGIELFISRAIQSLDPSNQSARIYICYGNSDRAKERFLPVYEVFSSSGLMTRWIFDKFNRYHEAESIGGSSSLFVLDTTSKTKPLITGNYDKPIYTNN